MNAGARIATKYYDSPEIKKKKQKPESEPVELSPPFPVPAGPSAKRELFSEAVFESIQLLRVQLRHPDSGLSQKAALTLLGLQETVLRHGGSLMGTRLPQHVEAVELSDHMSDARYGKGPNLEKMDKATYRKRKAGVSRLQQKMQREAHERGLGEFVDWSQACFEYERLMNQKGEKAKPVASQVPPTKELNALDGNAPESRAGREPAVRPTDGRSGAGESLQTERPSPGVAVRPRPVDEGHFLPTCTPILNLDTVPSLSRELR